MTDSASTAIDQLFQPGRARSTQRAVGRVLDVLATTDDPRQCGGVVMGRAGDGSVVWRQPVEVGPPASWLYWREGPGSNDRTILVLETDPGSLPPTD